MARKQTARFRVIVLPIALLGCLLLAACCGGDGDGSRSDDSAAVAVLSAPGGEVEVDAPDAEESGLVDPVLDEAAESLAAQDEPPDAVEVIGERVVVEVIADPGDLPAVREQVARLGGALKGSVPPTLQQALVPAASLAELEDSEAVASVRVPLEGDLPQEAASPQPGAGGYLGEEVAKTNAAAWHAAGQTGAGVKVGIIDSFDGGVWSRAQAVGEVPAAAGVLCHAFGQPCDVWGDGKYGRHGIGVAEIVHEMAPGAQLYLATAVTAADLAVAADFFADNGVRIVTRSQGAEYDGPGDGTGPYADVVERAVAQGMAWLNSAGNSAGRTGPGGYWRGPWRDADGNGWLEFGQGVELLPFTCRFVQGLRWSDWGAEKTDYDLFFFGPDGNRLAKSEEGLADQRRGPDVPPLEHIRCPGEGREHLVAIQLRHQGNGTDGDVLELQVIGRLGNEELQVHVNPRSATQPVADSASPGMLAVGAVGDNPLGFDIAPYSSEGPTNDDRIKPDISAATCVRSLAYAEGCFDGTSAATPVVAGAAALVLGAGLVDGPEELKSYLLGATAPRGASGPDNVFGWGELLLRAPPSP